MMTKGLCWVRGAHPNLALYRFRCVGCKKTGFFYSFIRKRRGAWHEQALLGNHSVEPKFWEMVEQGSLVKVYDPRRVVIHTVDYGQILACRGFSRRSARRGPGEACSRQRSRSRVNFKKATTQWAPRCTPL